MLRCWHTSSVKADDAFVTDILMTHVLSCRYLYNYATIIPNSASTCKHSHNDDSPNYRMRDAFDVGTGLAPVLVLICLSWFVLPCPGSYLKVGLVRSQHSQKLAFSNLLLVQFVLQYNQ